MSDGSNPIGLDELEVLFAPLCNDLSAPSALAVSGGSDSTALMALLAEWLRHRRIETTSHTVLTVDHGLRPESAAEASEVAARAAALGFRHVILTWHGPKPQTGVQQAARAARYRLMDAYMAANGIGLLLTAHTRDDVAETFLMRLARGSGLDGLAAMTPRARLSDLGIADPSVISGAEIARPLLGLSKDRLRATLQARGLSWIEDASNQSPTFERPRLRAARAVLDDLGLTDAMLALSATRLLRARRALEQSVAQFCCASSGAVRANPRGILTLDLARLRAAEPEIALRVLARAIAAAGGSDQPVPLAKLEALFEGLQRAGRDPVRWTLARSMISAEYPTLSVQREPGREPLPGMVLRQGESALWDGRFHVRIAPEFTGGTLEVRGLGDAGQRALRELDATATQVQAGATMVPAFWSGDTLVAVPSLGYWADALARRCLSADFAWECE
jgi:tRNA(Ile)-lysidine synthase